MLLELLEHSQELFLDVCKRLWSQNMRAVGRLMSACKCLNNFIMRNQCLNDLINHYKQQINICKDINSMNLHYSGIIVSSIYRTIREFNGKLTIYEVYNYHNYIRSYTIKNDYFILIGISSTVSYAKHKKKYPFDLSIDYIPHWLYKYDRKLIAIKRNININNGHVWLSITDTTGMEKLEPISKKEIDDMNISRDFRNLYWNADVSN